MMKHNNDSAAKTYKFFAVFFLAMMIASIIFWIINKQRNGLFFLDAILALWFAWLWAYENIPEPGKEETEAENKAKELRRRRFESRPTKEKVIRIMGDLLLQPMLLLLISLLFAGNADNKEVIKLFAKVTNNSTDASLACNLVMHSIAILFAIISIFYLLYITAGFIVNANKLKPQNQPLADKNKYESEVRK